jgi:hypothetical protein
VLAVFPHAKGDAQIFLDPFGSAHRVGEMIDLEKDREFVTAQASHGVRGAEDGSQTIGYTGEELIAE